MSPTAESPIGTPSAPAALAEEAKSTLDAALRRLDAHKQAWVETSIDGRIALLRRCLDATRDVAADWVASACAAKGVDPAATAAGEEWVSGPMTTVRNLRLMIGALRASGAPRPNKVKDGPGGRKIAHVFPGNLLELAAFSGITAQVWIKPGHEASQGRIYREKRAGRKSAGAVSLVLGAGNVSSIGPLDVLHKLFVEDEVVLLKMNPVNAYLAPILARAFAPLVEAGFLEIVGGGAEAGAYLCGHPLVGTIHLTGSGRTHDAIVWGATPEEQARRKAARDPVVTKPVTSELGCVTPVLVVPGRWSKGDIDFQARHIAAMVAHNGSFNCNAAKVLVLAKGWPQRGEFLSALSAALARTPARKAYYPGAEDRYRRFLDRYPQARALGPQGSGVVPWTMIPDVTPRAGEFALTEEAFCGVLAEVTLEADDAPTFLREAVRFANEQVWGTLSCVVMAKGSTQRAHRAAFEQAIADLRYGDIGVNVWTGAAFAIGNTSWGAYPGQTLEDVGSGIGTVHNVFLYDHPEKSVVRAPFRLLPKPLWFADHRTLARLGPMVVRFEHSPTWLKLPKIGLVALLG